MRVHLAAPQLSWKDELTGHHLLVSYWESRQLKVLNAGWDTPGILIDSGAWSAYNDRRGREVVLGEYMEFLHRTDRGNVLGYFNLDEIPPSADELTVNRAAEKSLRNFEAMQDDGLNPIPVYHYGESPDFLDEYVFKGCPLIGLGPGMLRRIRRGFTDWFLEIFERWPDQGFHGLGVTNPLLIKYLPFESVDSTTYVYAAKRGPRCMKWLLKHLPTSFYERWNIEWEDQFFEYFCMERNPSLYRKFGIDAITSLERCKSGQLPDPARREYLRRIEEGMLKGQYDGEVPLWNLVDRLFEDGTIYDYDRFYSGLGLPPEKDPVNW